MWVPHTSWTFLVIANDRERDTTSSYGCYGGGGVVVAIIPNTGSEGQCRRWGMFIARFTDLNFAYEISLCYDSHTMRQKHKYSY